jgi:hypothetical protein
MIITSIAVNTAVSLSLLLSPPKMVKEVKGWSFYDGSKDSLLVEHKTYAKDGKLLTDSQPQYYCDQQYKYDSQNRIIQYDITCGESSGNGTTIFTYEKNKHHAYESASGYTREITSFYDDEKRKIRTIETYIDENNGDWFYYTLTEFSYDAKNRILKETKYNNETFRKGDENKDFRNHPETNIFHFHYAYTSFNSLSTITRVSADGKDSLITTLIKYDPKTHRQIYNQRIYNEDYCWRYAWIYDKAGRIISEQYSSSLTSWTSKKVFTYNRAGLKTSLSSYDEKSKIDENVNYFYKDGLLSKEIRYGKNKQVSEMIHYYYTFWD